MRSVVRVYLGPPPKNEQATGDIAQLGERRLCKPEVTGSIPVISTSENQMLLPACLPAEDIELAL